MAQNGLAVAAVVPLPAEAKCRLCKNPCGTSELLVFLSLSDKMD